MKKLLLLMLLSLTYCGIGQTIVKNVNAADFKKMIGQPNTVLIDLRTPDEINAKGMIKGAKQIDYFGKDAEATIRELDKSKTYLIYCAGGGRSGQCAELMEKHGFKEVVNLEKGFDEWKKNGFDIEKK